IKGAQKVFRDKGVRHVAEIGRASRVAPAAFSKASVGVSTENQPRGARAMLAVVERAHAEPALVVPEVIEPKVIEPAEPEMADVIASEERVQLEGLLSELLRMKSRLRAVMPARSA